MGAETFLYPNVSSIPLKNGGLPTDRAIKKQDSGVKGEFDQVFEKTLDSVNPDLSAIRQPLKISAHAAQRLQDRKIKLDPATMAKVNEAVDRAAAKGVEDTLVLTNDAALIVSVKNKTVITALDRNSLSGNVFTNIDGAVIV